MINFAGIFLPLIIHHITVEGDVFVPAGFMEVLADLSLNGGRDGTLAVAVLIVIGSAMLANEMLTYVRLHLSGHVVVEDVHHAEGKRYLLRRAEKGTARCAHILRAQVDAIVGVSVVGQLLPHQPMQALLLQGAMRCETNGIATDGFFFK